MIGGPQGLQDGLQQRAGHIVRLAVDRGLGLLVGELGGRTHQAADELVAALAPLGVEHHPHGQAGAGLAEPQRAQAVGQALGEHGLHPVGEIDAVGLFAGLLVQGRGRPDIGRDIGDGDPDHAAAGIVGGVVRLGVDRVIVVASVGRVDGD